ncbi:hypothetical protein AB6900_12395 [Carnobacterium maltaromaticum]|nr:hypothetical protein IV75_GL002360 [Carnobacterium maltaromaticum]
MSLKEFKKLFVLTSFYEPVLREKDEISRWQRTPHRISPIFLSGLIGSTNFLSRLVLMSQSFEKKIKSPQSKKILCVYFPIFLPELVGSTNFLL